MNPPRAKVLERLVPGLEGTGGGDGNVIVGQQRLQGLDVRGENGVAPFVLKLVDFVAGLVLLPKGHTGGIGDCERGQRKAAATRHRLAGGGQAGLRIRLPDPAYAYTVDPEGAPVKWKIYKKSSRSTLGSSLPL